ncbi:hypothetical protein GGER_05290 [Serratia rubidaea]
MPISRYLDAMSWTDASFPDLDSESFEKYNFVIFEESINSADKEQLRRIVERTSCLILMLDRSMSSVRTVRQIAEIHDVICRTQNTPRRLFICLNDSRPVTSEMLGIEDLQLLLGRKVDIVFPWRNARTDTRFSALRFRPKKSSWKRCCSRCWANFLSRKARVFAGYRK